MLNKIKKSNQGFTIIEVLIVLAIAGLILLIVFLAVPALQRNSRNTTKKNDVSKALGSVNEWVSNNSGKVPDNSVATVSSIQNSAGLTDGVTVTVAKDESGVVGASQDVIQIVTGVQCSGSGVTTDTLSALDAAKMKTLVNAGSARAYVALYVVEASNGKYTSQCQGS